MVPARSSRRIPSAKSTSGSSSRNHFATTLASITSLSAILPKLPKSLNDVEFHRPDLLAESDDLLIERALLGRQPPEQLEPLRSSGRTFCRGTRDRPGRRYRFIYGLKRHDGPPTRM